METEIGHPLSRKLWGMITLIKIKVYSGQSLNLFSNSLTVLISIGTLISYCIKRVSLIIGKQLIWSTQIHSLSKTILNSMSTTCQIRISHLKLEESSFLGLLSQNCSLHILMVLMKRKKIQKTTLLCTVSLMIVDLRYLKIVTVSREANTLHNKQSCSILNCLNKYIFNLRKYLTSSLINWTERETYITILGSLPVSHLKQEELD